MYVCGNDHERLVIDQLALPLHLPPNSFSRRLEIRMNRLAALALFVALLATACGALRLEGSVEEPTGLTSVSQLTVPLLGGRAGLYWGSISSSLVEEVCDALLTEGFNMTIEAELDGYGVVKEHIVQLIAITGCTHPSSASPASPAGVQALIENVQTGSQYAVICGNYIKGTGLDYNTPVSECAVYQTGKDVEAVLSGSSRRRRLQQKNDITINNGAICPACISNCTCVQVNPTTTVNCFPADSHVFIKGLGSVKIEELRVGQKVLAVDGKGRKSFQEVVFFGHRDASTVGRVVALDVRGPGGGGTRSLRLSARHFLPTMAASGSFFHKYAEEVQLGDKLLLAEAGSEPVVGEVVGKSVELATGMFNPYTKNGYIVVDGVLASAHSDFILDDITPTCLRHLLPAMYQAAFAPITLIYNILGHGFVECISDQLVPLVLSNLRAFSLTLLVAGALTATTVSRVAQAAYRRVGKAKQL